MQTPLPVFGLFKTLLVCNHTQTAVHEGKCFCPDCGSGLIYRWVVLRCGECGIRRESRYFLRQVVPVQRCCPDCGQAGYQVETLDSPDYFQLAKARLAIVEAEVTMPPLITLIWEQGKTWAQKQPEAAVRQCFPIPS